jgi:hypothetical protein
MTISRDRIGATGATCWHEVPSKDDSGDIGAEPFAARPPTPGSDTGGRVFVGRNRQLAELAGALKAGASGSGSLFLVSGEAGIGKTWLAEEVARIAGGESLQVRWGRCRERREGTNAPPYWPWIQAWRAPTGSAGTPNPPACDHRACRLLQSAAAACSTGAAGAAGYHQFWLMDSTVELFRQSAGVQPILLVLDDLQWADEASLRLLEFLAPELAGIPLVVVGIFREPEVLADPALRSTLGRLSRLGRCLPLGGLRSREVEEVVVRRFALCLAPEAIDHLCTLTGGNPWFIDQMVRLRLPDDGTGLGAWDIPGHPAVPEAVRSAVRRRLEPLPPDSRWLLERAAAIGNELPLVALEEVTGLSEHDLLELLDQPAIRQIVLPDDLSRGVVRFCPPVVAEALYDDLDLVQRIELRRRVGEVVDSLALGGQAGEPAPAGRLPAGAGGPESFDGPGIVASIHGERAGASMTWPATPTPADVPAATSFRNQAPEQPGAAPRPEPGAPRAEPSVRQGPPATVSIFRQEGEYWTIAYAGTTVRLKDAKGFRYLAQLLARPLLEMHVADLPLIVGHMTRDQPERGAGADLVGAGLTVRRLGDAGQLLDARAKEAYRRRLECLQEGLREAQEFNDDERRALIEQEMDALAHELAASVGLSGRDRKAASAAERARVNVTRTIRAAIDKIAQGNPSLGLHLTVSIKTGTFCSYTPDPAAHPTWHL